MRLYSSCFLFLVVTTLSALSARAEESRFIDLSLMVAPDYPCTWADGFPRFRIEHVKKIGRDSTYNIDTLIIDGNTGTQIDVPPHSVARPELNLPHSGPLGNEFTDKTPAWKFVGEACVVDIRALLDTTANGISSLVSRERIIEWEKQNRPFGFGDVALMYSGYSEKYYRPLPAGRRFLADVLGKKFSGWPGPDPETMEYLASHNVFHIGTDSPTMAPLPDLGEPVHYAALKYGAIFTEGATNLSQLPTTGAFYCTMGPKHQGGPYGEGRALAIVGGDLPKTLIASARRKRAIDLSVTMSIDHPLTWPGKGVDRHRHRYTKTEFLYSDNLQLYHHGHIMDSHAGTHLVPPSYALPAEPISANAYSPETRLWLEEYEKDFGPRGVSDVTTEKVPLSQTCGWARVIDVRHLVGTTGRADWPASPRITVGEIKMYESAHGKLKAGEVVIFHSGHTDRYFKPRLAGNGCLVDPVNGNSEGWPAPGPRTIAYLADRGIRCVATDGPSLGGVDPKTALMTYWMLGTNEMVGVEFLTNVGALPEKAYFLFAPVKIRDCHGGPGRAIALY